MVLGFRLPSSEAVNQRYAELTAAGYIGRQPPFDAFWGARYAIVADPDGNDVGLMGPIDDASRHMPPTESPESVGGDDCRCGGGWTRSGAEAAVLPAHRTPTAGR